MSSFEGDFLFLEHSTASDHPGLLGLNGSNLTSSGYETGVHDDVTPSLAPPRVPSVILSTADLCTRLSPPPIPPWMLEAPEKLRHVMANCSSWRKYVDLCFSQLPPEYPQVLASQPMSGSTAVRWIPFIVVLFLCFFIVVAVVVIYSLYRSKRMKFGFFAEYHKRGLAPKDYCSPGGRGFISPSVTIETQLSVCALDDDGPYANIVSPHLMYNDPRYGRPEIQEPVSSQSEQRQRQGNHLYDKVPASSSSSSRPPLQYQQELLLAPTRLTDDDSGLSSPVFVTDLSSSSDYYSSLSLPIESEGSKSLGTAGKGPRTSVYSGCDSEDENISCYVEIHKGKGLEGSTSSSSRRAIEPHINTRDNRPSSSSQKRKGNMRRMVQRCKKAGASLVHGVVWNRSSGSSSVASDVGAEPPALRSNSSNWSLRKPKPFVPYPRSSQARPCSVQVTTPEFPQLSDASYSTMSQKSDDEPADMLTRNGDVGRGDEPSIQTIEPSANSSSEDKVLSKLRNFGKFVGHRPSFKRKRKNKDSKVPTSSLPPEPMTPSATKGGENSNHPDFTFVNEGLDKTTDPDSKVRKSHFRKMKMPNVLKRLGKT
ncbi:uncharacterized protein LOC101852301 [Aplysia californica]|uniref:Uncharacterized protein LOC101852301 n=1 Tax=Aplysia californica TaxID=6500 RepID=A0ABM1A941_APLCA|nr:uncharacterized protein LOC101852301 [Aplysia californica]